MNETTYLFAVPSALEGAARILDIGNTITEYNDLPTPEAADALATYMDWRAVGLDIARAAGDFGAASDAG